MSSKKVIRRPISRGGRSPQTEITSFGNSGALFGKDDKAEDLHPQILKMARKSGQLNLSNKGLSKIPRKVFYLNEMNEEETKKVTVNMKMADDSDDKWWEQSDLQRLYLNSNALTCVDSLISNLGALQLLELSDNRLTTLPSEIKELRALNRLVLSRNDLQELPDDLCRLDDLRVLLVDHNNLTKLPEDIGSLCVLEQLDASHNSLDRLPPSVGYLQRLNKLMLSDNLIEHIPVEIGDLFGLVNLDLTRNKLTELPSTVSNLPKLESLCLRQNLLSKLPGLMCPNLKELYLGANRIKVLEESSIEALTGLHVLDISDNGLETLPDNITLLQQLRRLDLTSNYISSLPNHIGLLLHLKAMPLEGNPLRQIRRDIIQRGTSQLLKHLASKLTDPPNSYPGCDGYVPEVTPQTEKSIPDQYEMRNMRAMVYNTKCDKVPDELFENGHLAQVRIANLSENRLTAIPTKLSMLANHLYELVVSHNKLESLPECLSEFKHLQFIDAQNNYLTSLPEGLANLNELREINISYNRFEKVPDVVYNVVSLEIFFAGNNKIVKIEADNFLRMDRLATLDLHNNNIDFVPPILGKMTQLRNIQLEGNAFRVPRYDILAKGSPFVLEYLRSRIVDS